MSLVGDGSSQVYGVDGRLAFYDDFSITGYFANTQTPARKRQENSYQGLFDYTGDLYGLSYGHLVVENRFIPEVGFIPRDNFRRNSASARFSPRPESIDLIRRFVVSGRFEHIATADRGDLETREAQLLLESEFENSDQLSFFLNDHYELLTGPFTISPGVTIPVGGYNFRNFQVSYRFGAQRPVSGQITVQTGSFWSGDNTSLALSRGRVEVTPQLSVEPSVSFNWVDLPEGSLIRSSSERGSPIPSHPGCSSADCYSTAPVGTRSVQIFGSVGSTVPAAKSSSSTQRTGIRTPWSPAVSRSFATADWS